MTHVFFYRYLGESQPHDSPERRDDGTPAPSRGDMLTRHGKIWRVDSVACVKTIVPKDRKLLPTEFHITLAPAET